MPYQKTKEGRLVNEITLGDGYPLSNDKQPLKVGGEASIINVSSPTPDGSVDGEVEIKGNLKAKDTAIEGNFSATSIESVPQFKFHSRNNISARLDVEASANQTSSIRIKNNQGYFDIKRLYSTTSLQFTDGTNTPLTLDGNNVEFTNLTDGSITIDSFVDEDNMSSNSATKIPTQQSVKAYVDNEVAGLVDSAPAALDTLNELAAALNDDASFSTTITNSLATKVGLTGDETVAGHKKFSDDVLIAGSAADPATDDEVSLGVSAAQFRVHTNHGYVQIGPANTNWSHFYTDRDRYYFNKPVIVDGDYIASYNEDLVLRRVYNDTSYNQITIGDDSFELKLDNTARLAIDGDGTATLAGDLRVGDGTEGIRLLNISSNIAGIYGVDTGGSAWNSIHIKADGNDGLFIEKDTNKVGIGTTSPTEPLEVWSANSEAYHYPIVARNPYNSASNLNYGVGIKLKLDDASENKWAGIIYEADSAYGNSGDLAFYIDGATNTSPRLKLQHEGGLTLRHGGWNGMVIQNTANTNGSHLELKNTERRFQVAVRSNGFDIRDVTASDTSRFFINSSGTASFQDNDITNVGDISVDKIKADTASDVNIMFNTSGMTFNVETGDSYQFNLGEVDADLVYYDSEESDLFKIDSGNKRVGIGLSSPTTTLDVEGTVSYKHTSLTADSDDLDVSGVTVVECTPSGTDRLGGLVGGVQGQILYILKVDSGFGRIIIEHNEGTGNQDIFLSGGADVQLSTRGGMTLYCNGTSWFALDK